MCIDNVMGKGYTKYYSASIYSTACTKCDHKLSLVWHTLKYKGQLLEGQNFKQT